MPPIVSKKRLLGYDAQGTDGKDDSKICAVYQVVGDDGYQRNVVIKKSLMPTADVEINKELSRGK